MIYQLAIAASIAALASARVFTEDPTNQKYLWDNFKRDFQRSYESMDEETHRFHIFIENLKLADHRNELEQRHGGSAVHGITRFSDLSQVEFESRHLSADPSMKSGSKNIWTPDRAVDPSLGLVDWSEKYSTPVKNQGYCGSCWAFSATEQVESDATRVLGTKYTLSTEQTTQCTKGAFGCGGGWTESAYNYIKSAGGLVLDSTYPYTNATFYGTTGTCDVNTKQAVVSITGFTTVSGESDMASYVQGTGPLSVCLDANNWNSYKGGIMSNCGTSVDHCVQAAGVDVAGGYWLVRNSWDVTWGEKGFIRLAYGHNTCAITNDPTYVTPVKA
jgi:C1A family cysteine protease